VTTKAFKIATHQNNQQTNKRIILTHASQQQHNQYNQKTARDNNTKHLILSRSIDMLEKNCIEGKQPPEDGCMKPKHVVEEEEENK
jgi:hypothetical protein